MSDFKKYVSFIAVLALLFPACRSARQAFKPSDIKGALFDNIMSIAEKSSPRYSISGLDSVLMYKAVFRDKLVEDNNILEYALVRDGSLQPTVDYIPQSTSYFELYLFMLPSSNRLQTPVVFFTVRYDSDKTCLGFGQNYFGYASWKGYQKITERGDTLNDSTYVMEFVTKVKPKRENETYRFEKKDDAKLYFVVDSIKPERVTISKLLLREHNKISGDKQLVYPMELISGDKNGLTFFRKGSFKLKQ